MRIAVFQSNTGSGPHVAQLDRGLAALGHWVEAYRPGGGYDLILVHNQVAHRTDYAYPDFPTEDTPFAFVDFAEYGYFARLPDRAHLWANSFTPSAMCHDTKNQAEQERLRQWLEGKHYPYFIREKSRLIDYPASYYPIDYPLYHLSHCDQTPNRENYLARPLDLFCQWGMSHPWRVNITDALVTAPCTSEIGDRWGPGGNLPQSLYFAKMQQAKTSVSYDGYGSGSFRMTEVLVRTLLLQGPLSIETHAELADGVTCRKYQVESSGETFCGTNVVDVMRDALADPEGSYEIYRNGYDHCMSHLTEKATAAYLLETVERHDWSAPTPLEV